MKSQSLAQKQPVENSFMNDYSTRELQIMCGHILSNENATSIFIKQFKADHDSVQFYKNVIIWYMETYNDFPDKFL